jgi:hypothetical protein
MDSDQLLALARRQAAGGGSQVKKSSARKPHVGPILSHVAGRTDHLNMTVPSGAYVIPADIISGMGQGNTIAGFKVAKDVFGIPVYGGKLGEGAAYGQATAPYGRDLPGKAEGGEVDGVPIVAAGGELVLSPDQVMQLGLGSLDDGHRVLDEFVKAYRQQLVNTLSKLPGPKKN